MFTDLISHNFHGFFFRDSEMKRTNLLAHWKIWISASFLKTATICVNSVIFNYKLFLLLLMLLFETQFKQTQLQILVYPKIHSY